MTFELESTAADHMHGSRDLCDDYTRSEHALIAELSTQASFTESANKAIAERTVALVSACRRQAGRGGLFDKFLQEFGLSSKEGVTLMRLSEALIRTPDDDTARRLVRDKLLSGAWHDHAGSSPSLTVNLATRGLMVASGWARRTGGVEADALIARLGDKVMLAAIKRGMAIMSGHFVLNRTIESALTKSSKGERKGGTFSYDMLGEAAHTHEDADRYFAAYCAAAEAIARKAALYDDWRRAPGISVKLSALHPRYESVQKSRCTPILVDRLGQLCIIAKKAGFGVTIDAEEADRLELSLDIVDHLLRDPDLIGWDGLSIVVQAYQRRAMQTINRLTNSARRAGRKICIRLVKGAYWDMEIKRAQELGLESYPVFTRKENTDVSYIACARALFEASDIVFPQFATHNAQTAAAIVELADGSKNYEFQRLHGMGAPLHRALTDNFGIVSRIYAPVGEYQDLLPYLVRRLLENGANSSFVNQLLDPDIPAMDLAVDPVARTHENTYAQHPAICDPRDQFEGVRLAAAGVDFTQSRIATGLEGAAARRPSGSAASIINGVDHLGQLTEIFNPADASEPIGVAAAACGEQLNDALRIARNSSWFSHLSPGERQACLMRAADLLEEEIEAFIALCVHEAGKTIPDAIAEVREAVDFCRYYAVQITSDAMVDRTPLGVVACISPWNFPLAIFLGQITAALAAGNAVIAKPAEQTPLIAHAAISLLHRAGVPVDAVQLVLGSGTKVGSSLIRSASVSGVCFTGSTATAKHIAIDLADTDRALTPLIAETGGLNGMLIESTALLEQAVADVVASAFESTGQRCSACRLVLVQHDIADDFIRMLSGSMNALVMGDPAKLETDIGPVIDDAARDMLAAYIKRGRETWKVIGETPVSDACQDGYFIAPIAFEIPDISVLDEEKFGPVLHVVRFASNELTKSIEKINRLGYGLTMGLHSRIDATVEDVSDRACVGNLYVNRNQIGAVVGVQPFGGEGLSGTGPKAGGPHYVRRLSKPPLRRSSGYCGTAAIAVQTVATSGAERIVAQARTAANAGRSQDRHRVLFAWTKRLRQINDLYADSITQIVNDNVAASINPIELPGPTGETNSLSLYPRGVLICHAGEDWSRLASQTALGLVFGNSVIIATPYGFGAHAGRWRDAFVRAGGPADMIQVVDDSAFSILLADDIDGVVVDGALRESAAKILISRPGAILPVLSAGDDPERFAVERTKTINTTAAGGNASLLAIE